MEALWLVAQIRVGLWLFPFKLVQRRYGRSRQRPPDSHTDMIDTGAARSIGAAVRRSSRLVPAATCLPQALAARVMLERRAVPNELRFGVARANTGALEAHAWVEVDGAVIVGNLPDLSRYQRMPDLPADLA
jgi:hypothetical protein